jgi:hypothetical protein
LAEHARRSGTAVLGGDRRGGQRDIRALSARDNSATAGNKPPKGNTDLGRAQNQTACRLHALLAELAPGGIPNEINAASAERVLGDRDGP